MTFLELFACIIGGIIAGAVIIVALFAVLYVIIAAFSDVNLEVEDEEPEL